jgi:FixJ family two-component response regulator
MGDPVHLSPREREIARLMAEGLSYSQIGDAIGWQTQSVRLAAHRMANKMPGRGQPIIKILTWEIRRQHESGTNKASGAA